MMLHYTGALDSFDYHELDPKDPTTVGPVLVEGAESFVGATPILKHLVARLQLADHWYPADAAARARVDSWLSVHEEKFPSEPQSAFGKTYWSEVEHADVDAELKAFEDALKLLEEQYLRDHKFIGGDDGPSIADVLIGAWLIQAQYGRLVEDLFHFPKVAMMVQAIKTLPGAQFVFRDLDAFLKALPSVRSQQVTIRGNREVLKNLRKARPKRAGRNAKGLPQLE